MKYSHNTWTNNGGSALESMEYERVRLCQIKETVIVREEAFLKLLALLQQQ
jgi:hypothetical protein